MFLKTTLFAVSLNVSIQNSFKSSINKYPSGPEHLSKANKINRNDFIGFLVARYMTCSCSNSERETWF